MKLRCRMAVLCLLAGACDGTARGETLESQKSVLTLTRTTLGAAAVDLKFKRGDGSVRTFRTKQPVSLQLLDTTGATNWVSADYVSVTRVGKSLHCAGEVHSPGGSVFHCADAYTAGPIANSFVVAREITLWQAGTNDAGFLSRFSVSETTPALLREHEFFIPGIWYRDNRNVPAHALAADLADNYFIIREDRMPLPLVMMRDPRSGIALTLIHLEPDGTTCLADYTPARVVDARIQVASLGVFSQWNPAVAFYFPATEGERSYLRAPGRRGNRGNLQPQRWVERFHPVQPGVKHTYKLLIVLAETQDFPSAMREAWRTAFDRIHPPVARTDVGASYEASIKLLATWSKTTKGAPGIPFRLRLPTGELEDAEKINYQMGFVGQQLPLAYHLLRYGLHHQNDEITRKGEAMVDFWATNSLTPEGLPRTWYNTFPEPHWRDYNTFLRVASDGMVGALMAWDVMHHYGRAKPEWIKFCRGFGDWLIRHQQPDGSWSREYDWTSRPVDAGKQNTSHPIRFLIDLSKATGDRNYLHAAGRAGNFCWTNEHRAFAYVGGTVDNPNVIDKEAGFMATEAFLALHDVTGEQRWLEAAAQAADFMETWVYSWNIPIPTEDTAVTYPRGASTTGFSLIATGHSAADLFMAGAPFLYYRLYLKTGDRHYGDMARQLLYDTKQSVDIDGSLGYGHTGLCTEALSLAPRRGHGVNTWLPWLTYSMIEPITKLQDAYGTTDTPFVEGARLEELRVKDRAFAQSRGLFSGGRQ